MGIRRNEIINALVKSLEPLEYVHTVWEGGAAAFDRVDEWSDIDIGVVADDNKINDVFSVIDEALSNLSPIEIEYAVPPPGWHGIAQKFYRLENTSRFLVIDLSVIKLSDENKFVEPAIHGKSKVHIDKINLITGYKSEGNSIKANALNRIPDLKTSFELFDTLPEKEYNRGNYIEAIQFYYGFIIRPLVEALRIKYKPERHGFHTRYIHYDIPPEEVEKLQDLFYICSPSELPVKQAAAKEWFGEIIKEIESRQQT